MNAVRVVFPYGYHSSAIIVDSKSAVLTNRWAKPAIIKTKSIASITYIVCILIKRALSDLTRKGSVTR